jgi:hypothetical protein
VSKRPRSLAQRKTSAIKAGTSLNALKPKKAKNIGARTRLALTRSPPSAKKRGQDYGHKAAQRRPIEKYPPVFAIRNGKAANT